MNEMLDSCYGMKKNIRGPAYRITSCIRFLHFWFITMYGTVAASLFFVHQMYNALTGYVHIAITADRLGKALYCLPCTDNKFGSFVLRYAVLFR